MNSRDTAGPSQRPGGQSLRLTVGFALAEFCLNAALVFVGYRLVIAERGLEAVGLWASLWALVSLVRIGDLGLAGATTRFLALLDPVRDAPAIRAHIETAVVTNIVLFGVLTIGGHAAISSLLPGLIGTQLLSEAAGVLPLMFCAYFLFNMANLTAAALQGLQLGYRKSQFAIAASLLNLALTVMLVPSIGLRGLALAQIGQYGVLALACWLSLRRRCDIAAYGPLRFDWHVLRSMLHYSLRAQLAGLANGLFEPISKLLVGFFGGMSALGLYELAFKTTWLVRNAVISGTTATLPAITQLTADDRLAAKKLYRRTAQFTTCSAIVLIGAAILMSPLFGRIWLGDWDMRYVGYTALLGLAAMLSAVGASAYVLAFATGVLRPILIINSAMLAVLVLGGAGMGMAFGADGVVVLVALVISAGGIATRYINRDLLD